MRPSKNRRDATCPAPADDRPAEKIRRLQAKLATRLLLIFLIPLAALVGIGVYAYDLSSRLSQLEVGSKVAAIEKDWKDYHNLELAIHEYEELASHHPNPEILQRLGGLYYTRASDSSGAGAAHRESVDLAIRTLQRANEMYHGHNGKNYWMAKKTLAYVYFDTGEHAWDRAIEAGEEAIAANPYDNESLATLAWIYAYSQDPTMQNLSHAEAYAKRAVRLTRYRDKDSLDTLVRILLKQGGEDPLGSLAAHYRDNGGTDRFVEVLEDIMREEEKHDEHERSITKTAIAHLQSQLDSLKSERA